VLCGCEDQHLATNLSSRIAMYQVEAKCHQPLPMHQSSVETDGCGSTVQLPGGEAGRHQDGCSEKADNSSSVLLHPPVVVQLRVTGAGKRDATMLKRPVSASGQRRPMSDFAKLANAMGDMNPRSVAPELELFVSSTTSPHAICLDAHAAI
jgi:hypothetical protein